MTLEEFQRHLNAAASQSPAKAEKYLKQAGNALKKQAAQATPDSGTSHRKKLSKSWNGEVVGYVTNGTLQYQLRNKAPHYHLVERGHKQTARHSKKVVGHVAGRKFFAKALADYQTSQTEQKYLKKFWKDFKKEVEGH